MQIIPLSPVPSQTFTVLLAGQSCRINVYAKTTGVFVDLYVNNAPVVTGVIAQHANRIVREPYRGFAGDLALFDTQGSADPEYAGLGTRWVLGYLP